MRVLVAPDSFKGTLTARQAADAIAAGWTSVRPGDEVSLRPLSDGGDGLLDVMAGTPGWARHTGSVHDPLGRLTRANWLAREGEAVIESAAACGLHLVEPANRRPTRLTTYGVGELLRRAGAHADDRTRILVGLGGSSTVDGGLGMLTALGAVALDAQGRRTGSGGARDLGSVVRLDLDGAAEWFGRDVVLLADVTTPLTCSAEVFGPQKGASPADVALLTDQLLRWADVVEHATNRSGLREFPGGGAAGGLAFGLLALGARIVDGATFLADMLDLDGRLAHADLVLVGEGQLDETSLAGKVVGSVLVRAGRRGVPVAAVVGRARQHPRGLLRLAEASSSGPGVNPFADVRRAAARLAGEFAGDAGITRDRTNEVPS